MGSTSDGNDRTIGSRLRGISYRQHCPWVLVPGSKDNPASVEFLTVMQTINFIGVRGTDRSSKEGRGTIKFVEKVNSEKF